MTRSQIEEWIAKGYRYRYGILWPLVNGGPAPDWWIERACYVNRVEGTSIIPSHSAEHLGKLEHFKRFIDIVFNGPHNPNPINRIHWNPNAAKIIDYYFRYQFLAAVGHKSSSKSDPMAFISIAEFLADPENTKCFITSTSLKEAEQRVWGRVEHYWKIACEFFGGEQNMPGELMASGSIRRIDDKGRPDDTRGIVLIASDKRKSDQEDGVGKMKGFKAPRLRFFADELSDISKKIIEAAETNLYVADPDGFRMMAALNCDDPNDAGGEFCRPKNGWECPIADVDNSDGWESSRGYVLRFDAEKSPNVVARRKIYHGLLTYEDYMDRLEKIGNNANFQRQYRARWPKGSSKDTIYTTDLLLRGKAQKVADFTGHTIRLAGSDPSSSHGGDRFPLCIVRLGNGEIGKDKLGNPIIDKILEYVDIIYIDDDLDKSIEKSEQTTTKIANIILPRGQYPIEYGNLGMDVTGGGAVVADWLSTKWCSGIHRINFKSSPSDLPVSRINNMPCKKRYVNKMSEIWHIGIEFVNSGQIRNLPDKIVNQIIQRTFEEDSKGMITVEDKKKYKARVGESPDESDAFFIALDVARTAHGFMPNAKAVNKIKTELPEFMYDFDLRQLHESLAPKSGARKITELCKRYANARRSKRISC